MSAKVSVSIWSLFKRRVRKVILQYTVVRLLDRELDGEKIGKITLRLLSIFGHFSEFERVEN